MLRLFDNLFTYPFDNLFTYPFDNFFTYPFDNLRIFGSISNRYDLIPNGITYLNPVGNPNVYDELLVE